MSKFIKVTEQACGEVRLIPISSIKEVLEDGNGSVVFYGDERFFAKESLEQIEVQLIRDEFAMAALNATIIGLNSIVENYEHHGWSDQELVSESYRVADAMLKERSK